MEITKVKSAEVSVEDSRGLPVCRQKAAKSLTEPGSVATTRSTCPEDMSARAFLARRIGNGQLSPPRYGRFTVWNIAWLVVGGILFALAVFGTLNPTDAT